jgi:hypothetical protein
MASVANIALPAVFFASATPVVAQGLVPYYNLEPAQRPTFTTQAPAHGGPKSDQARQLKELKAENARLRRAVSELTPQLEVIRCPKCWWRHGGRQRVSWKETATPRWTSARSQCADNTLASIAQLVPYAW